MHSPREHVTVKEHDKLKNTVCKMRRKLFCKGMKAHFGFLNDCSICKDPA